MLDETALKTMDTKERSKSKKNKQTSKTLNKVKPVQKIKRNPHIFWGTSHTQKEFSLHVNYKTINISDRIFSKWKKITLHIDITGVKIHNIRRPLFKERFKTNKIRTKTTKTGKIKVWRVEWFKVILSLFF